MNEVNSIDLFGSWIEMGMALAAITVGIIMIVLPYIRRKRSRPAYSSIVDYPLNFNWEVHTRIHEILTELRVRTDCGRTQLVQFHNGGDFLDGISMKKMTLTHESLTLGVSSAIEYTKDIPLSLCVAGLTLLKKNTPKLHITEQMDDSWCKQFYQNNQVVALAFLPVRRNNQILGYVSCHWCSWGKTDDVDEINLETQLETSRDIIEVELQHQTGSLHT